MVLKRALRYPVGVLAVLAWLGAFVPCAVAADRAEQDKMYAKFIHHMHDKQYEQAVELAFARAKVGDGWARTALESWYYESGDPDDAPPPVKRLVDARLNKAAREGDADAQTALGMRILKSGNDSRLPEAVAWLEKAADQGNQGALYVLGSMSPEALASRGITSKHAGKLLRK